MFWRGSFNSSCRTYLELLIDRFLRISVEQFFPTRLASSSWSSDSRSDLIQNHKSDLVLVVGFLHNLEESTLQFSFNCCNSSLYLSTAYFSLSTCVWSIISFRHYCLHLQNGIKEFLFRDCVPYSLLAWAVLSLVTRLGRECISLLPMVQEQWNKPSCDKSGGPCPGLFAVG